MVEGESPLSRQEPKALPRENWHSLLPLDHVLLGSSVVNPDRPDEYLGGKQILDRGPGFYLQFPSEATDDELKADRGDVSFIDGVPGVFDPLNQFRLTKANYAFRILFPKADLEARTAPPRYEVQLTRRIQNGEEPVRYEPVPSTETLPEEIMDYWNNLAIVGTYKDVFKIGEASEAPHVRSLQISLVQ